MEGAGAFSKVHSWFSCELQPLKDTGSPLCYTRYIIYRLSDIAAVDLMNNTPKSQGIVVTVCQIRFLICMRVCISLEFSTIFGLSPGFVPASGRFTKLSAFTEGLIPLTEVLVPKIPVLSETSS